MQTFIMLEELENAFEVAKETFENNPRLFMNSDARFLSCLFGLKVALVYKHFNELNKINAVVESCDSFINNMIQSNALPQLLLNAQFNLAVIKDDLSRTMARLKRFPQSKLLLNTDITWPFYDGLRAQPEFAQTLKEINKHKTAEAKKVLAWLEQNPGALDSFFK